MSRDPLLEDGTTAWITSYEAEETLIEVISAETWCMRCGKDPSLDVEFEEDDSSMEHLDAQWSVFCAGCGAPIAFDVTIKDDETAQIHLSASVLAPPTPSRE